MKICELTQKESHEKVMLETNSKGRLGRTETGPKNKTFQAEETEPAPHALWRRC